MIPINLSNSPEPEMTTTAQQTVAEQNAPIPAKPTVDPKVKKRNDEFRSRADICKQYKRKLIQNWSASIDMRRGKPVGSQSDDDGMDVPMDWSLTKSKQASLFSQVPKVRVNHPPDTLEAWVAKFERTQNDYLVVGGIEDAMEECIPDCINAAGFGAVLISYESLTEDKEVPKMDLASLPPQIGAQVLQTGMLNGEEVEMEIVPETVDKRYPIQRISPSDFLFPLNFVGSNFNRAPWLGRSGRLTWEEAAPKFKLKDEDREKVMGEDRTILDRMTHDVEKDKIQPDEMVSFDEIFYKEHAFNSEVKSYGAIHHLVFVNGLSEPVIDEPWKGQDIDEEDGGLIGALKFPIQVLTLTYITDEAIPPSDSAIGRPMVNEINKFRKQCIKQRERLLPVRWFDVNRVDPAVQVNLMRGTWQNMIPVQGEGSRILGEVARAVIPPEDFTIDGIAKTDLSNSWTMGPNQLGSGVDVETKGESSEIASNFQTRVGRERAKVASFVTNIAEVLGGLMCLFEDPATFGEGFNPKFSRTLQYSILADSTVLVDSNQRLERLNTFMNTYAKSGFVNLEPVLKEIATLTGLDPSTCIVAPPPPVPPPPNVSLRLTGWEDMSKPLMLAILMSDGKAPDIAMIEQAKQLIQASVLLPPPAEVPGGPQIPPPLPEEQAAMPGEAPVPVGEANPDMTVLPKIGKRSDDPSIGGKVD